MIAAPVIGVYNVGTPSEGLFPAKSLAVANLQAVETADLSPRSQHNIKKFLPTIIPTSGTKLIPFVMTGSDSTLVKTSKPYVAATLPSVHLDTSSDEGLEVQELNEGAHQRTPRAMAPSPESVRGLTADEVEAVIGLQKLRSMSCSSSISMLSSMASEHMDDILEATPPPVRKIKPLKKRRGARKSSTGKECAVTDKTGAEIEVKNEDPSDFNETLPDGTYRPIGPPSTWTRPQWEAWLSQSPTPYPPLIPTPQTPQWTTQQYHRLRTHLHRLETDRIKKILNLNATSRLCPLPSLNGEALPWEQIEMDVGGLRRREGEGEGAWLADEEVVRDLLVMGVERGVLVGLGFKEEIGGRRALRRGAGGRL